MKIALVSTGLGYVWRGYERFTHDLFHLLKTDVDITLFKGGGVSGEREVVLPHFRRDGVLSFIRPYRKSYRDSYYFETFSFFAFLLPRLISGRYDLVHFTDCPLANFFYHAQRKLHLQYRFKTLFTNGNPITDGACTRVDFLHQLTPWQVRAVADFGIPLEKIIEVPFGVHCGRFGRQRDRSALRIKYGIPPDKMMILSVSAINRSHKRIDYLVREAAELGPKYFLVVAGHREDTSIEIMAKRLLGSNFRLMHLPFEKADELYGAADLFVTSSLIEGFGLALVEAMSSKVPVIAHQSEHYRWMVGSESSLADLSVQGNLARKVKEILSDQDLCSEMVHRNYENAIQRFDWSVLKDRYLEMYERALAIRSSRSLSTTAMNL